MTDTLDTGGRPVVVLSHRGPVSFSRDADGELQAVRGSGGLVTALLGLVPRMEDAVWVCHASGDADEEVAARAGGSVRLALAPDDTRVVDDDEEVDAPTVRVRPVSVDPDAHSDFYTVVANPLLWFVQHALFGLGTAPVLRRREHEAFEDGYVPVNEAFADAVVEEAQRAGGPGGRVVVLLHDYHFYLVADRVRAACPEAVISHFTHIPWPGPDAWRALPSSWRHRIFRGLLGCDVVAFHTNRFAQSFLLTVREELGLPVDLDAGTVEFEGRTVQARAYPISIDVEGVRDVVASDAAQDYSSELRERFVDSGNRLVLRVDRTDPSKNVVRGFEAFGLMLDEHPDLVGDVVFLAVLQPSRQDVPEYADYLHEIGGIVAEVNARHRRAGYEPVDLRMQDDLPLAMAAMTLAEVLVVNSVNDGMNLVAKESVTVNERDAALVLSENAGVAEEFGEHALLVSPVDVVDQARALHEALTMPREERSERLQAMRRTVAENDVVGWMAAQLRDLPT